MEDSYRQCQMCCSPQGSFYTSFNKYLCTECFLQASKLREKETVKVYFFKESGKYYTTEDITWTGSKEDYLLDEFCKVLKDHLTDSQTGRIRLDDMIAVCIDPCHKNAFPQMISVKKAILRGN